MWLAERNWAKSRNVDTPTRHAWKCVIGFLSTAFSPVSAASASANRSLWIHRSYYWHQQTIRDDPVKLTPFSHQNLTKIWDNHNFLKKEKTSLRFLKTTAEKFRLAREPKHILAKKAIFFLTWLWPSLSRFVPKLMLTLPRTLIAAPVIHSPIAMFKLSELGFSFQYPLAWCQNSSCFIKDQTTTTKTPHDASHIWNTISYAMVHPTNEWFLHSLEVMQPPYTNPLQILKHLFINLTGNHIQFFSTNSQAFYIFAVGIITSVSPVFLVFFQRLWQES